VSIKERKRALRRTANEAIAAMTAAERRSSDVAVCDVVRSLPAYASAEQVLAYWPMADEVDLRGLLFAAVENGKSVFLPVTADGSITFHRWRPQTGTTRGVLGVQEPASGEGPWQRPSIVLVPGRAFSPQGHRLGRGGGFYDRAWGVLKRFAPRVGIGYACQIFDEVPHDERDSVVDLLVCERGVVSGSAVRIT
jgi:5-formyltetrahydrofolate cyclo-ligase